MKNSVKMTVSSVFLLIALVAGPSALAQDKTVNDGVFTAAQVETGKLVYDSSCSACHDMRFYRDTLKSWNNQPLLWLWESVMGTMPADNPGSLMLDEYTDVIAYILSENGFPTGDTKLDPDNGMDAIKIATP
jgi:mono/diheme cytochrome c family protein